MTNIAFVTLADATDYAVGDFVLLGDTGTVTVVTEVGDGVIAVRLMTLWESIKWWFTFTWARRWWRDLKKQLRQYGGHAIARIAYLREKS